MTRGNEYIKISEMAEIHGISRQTLILYDKNGLLKPAYVSDTGYRYYTASQIPRLRFICLLKETGIPLARINEYLSGESDEDISAVLRHRMHEIEDQTARLEWQRQNVQKCQALYGHTDTKQKNVDAPFIQWLPERKAVFSPYPAGGMDPDKLHLTLMRAWKSLLGKGQIPSDGFGSILRVASLSTGDPLAGAGSIVLVPFAQDLGDDVACEVLPEGEYVTMYKYAMPYEPEPAQRLLAWMDARDLEPDGDVVDACILDTNFYNEESQTDFCQLQIKVRS